jgi:arylsulfatase A-like enzyme
VHTTKDGTPRPDRRVPPYDLPEPHRFRFLTREQAELEWSDAKLGAGGSYLTGWNRAFEKGRLAPERFPADQLAALEALYDGAIYYVDQRFGQLLDVLRSEGLYDDMLVVLTADHGEEFLDHGMFNHVQVYRELLRVPLLVKLPRQSDGRVIDAPVRLADIVPTLLEQAGIPVASELEGRPLQAAGRTAIASRRIFGSHHKPPGPDPERKQFSLREGEWTLVYGESRADGSRDVELYHTRVDTTEAHPVEGPAGRVEAMMRALEEWRSRARVSDGASVELDEKTAEDLRALGYVD